MRLLPLFSALLLAACATTIPPYPAVPAPLSDTQPLPPVSGDQLIWQPGHWDWTGTTYAWTPGQYVPAAGHGPLWVKEQWGLVNGQWQWQPAHWQG
jgi:WXXGXW repeat (2 copies)